ncbi:hypothetical protein SDC9_168342 [bioreactor metagenome]|uniref:Uncharacterized protein n=1 Tax=bioreactor metagenome TaxID=1076179 RepID=A0A645GAQ0_9ZZZZ
MRDLDAVRYGITTLEQLAAAHTKFDWESVANCIAYRLQNLSGKAQTVFKAATVLISPLVKIRGQKLINQPTVPAMHHQHFKACAFSQRSSIAISLDNITNLIRRKCFNHNSVRPDTIAGAIL